MVSVKNSIKIVWRLILSLLLLVLLFVIGLALPPVQTAIGKYVTDALNKKYKVQIAVDQVSLTIFGGVKLKRVLILDHHQDTLIYANRIKTDINDAKKLLDGNLIFGDIAADGLRLMMKIYKKEKLTNLDKFVEAFDTNEPPSKDRFLLTATKIKVTNGRYSHSNENQQVPVNVYFTNLNIAATALLIHGAEVSTTINKLSMNDHRGIYVANLNTKFSYTKKRIILENLNLLTKESRLKGYLAMNYEIEDFSNFTDKVEFDFDIEKSSIASNDLRCFYNEIGKDQYFKLRGRLKGPLNNLVASNLNIYNSRNSEIVGVINFRNLFPSAGKKFFMNGKFAKLTSSYTDLVGILPNILTAKLPVILKKLGVVSMVGNAKLSTTALDTNLQISTALGNLTTDMFITNIHLSDGASYKGIAVLNDFDIDTFIEKKNLGKLSMNIEVDGQGFSKKNVNTLVKGSISKIDFNAYSYTNIDLNIKCSGGLYSGQINSLDPNLLLSFDGLVDLTKKESNYDFSVKIDNADLHKLKFKKDSVALCKGNIKVQVAGNTIDNLVGTILFDDFLYQNPKSTYTFDQVKLSSSFDINRIRTILINSSDIASGEIVGKYEYKELEKLISNSLGSLYANYKPIKVKTGQFLKFNVIIFSKMIEIFYPEISVASSTVVKGNLNADDREFKLNFNSPKISVSGNTFDNIRIKLDNKNPLYNAFIEVDSIKNKLYTIRDFSIINVTIKDTLYFRSEFKGGTKGQDFFNLNLYHTINKDNKNVVGINKSEIKLKDYIWFLNETETTNSQIVFDKSFDDFYFDDISLTHENQKINFLGDIKGNNFKDLQLKVTNVDLNQLIPANPNFSLEGKINAMVDFKQDQSTYKPSASVQIDQLKVNTIELGHLDFDISGQENLKDFKIKSSLENKNTESLIVDGSFKIVEKSAILDVELKLDKFNLGILAPLGGEVISNIKGLASGNATIVGTLNKPEINGRIYIDDGTLKIPYLNVNYVLDQRTVVDLSDNKFLFKNNILTDSKFDTKGILNGVVEHRNFADWKLDLTINSKRLLVLDTKDAEDVAYYGVAFIDGVATIKGPANALVIKVNAKSEKGSALKIPINDSDNLTNNEFIHFLTPQEKFNLKKGIVNNSKNYKGLELEFDIDIFPNTEVEVILDRNTGHGLKGRGKGTILLSINTVGKFSMFGDFQAYEGTYNFKYGGLFDKKFNIKKGGYIIWEGDPLKAKLNLEAIYKTAANPAVLLQNSSYNRKIDVNLVIGIRGDLASPEPEFNFEFPTVTNVMKSEIDYKLVDKKVRETQALYLLSTGGFLSTEGVNQSAIYQSALDAASNMLTGMIKSTDEKFQVSLDIINADRTVGREADGRFVTSISSKINERVSLNGKIGVPFGGITQTAFVGNVELLYRVNEDGTVNLRIFNRENDINFIGEGIGYTQGVGISYEVDFDSFKEIINKLFPKNKIKKISTSTHANDDSIEFDGSKVPLKPQKSKAVTTDPNNEGIIPEEN